MLRQSQDIGIYLPGYLSIRIGDIDLSRGKTHFYCVMTGKNYGAELARPKGCFDAM